MTELTESTWRRRLGAGVTRALELAPGVPAAPAMLVALVFGMTMPWNHGSFAG